MKELETMDKEGYQVVFRKIVNGFDPHDDKFLLTDYIFRGLFKLREYLA